MLFFCRRLFLSPLFYTFIPYFYPFSLAVSAGTAQVVLLEVNINCGQGVMKWKVLMPQGMTRTEYDALTTYW